MVAALGNLHRIELRLPSRPPALQILPLSAGVGLFQTRAMPCRLAAATCSNLDSTNPDVPESIPTEFRHRIQLAATTSTATKAPQPSVIQ